MYVYIVSSLADEIKAVYSSYKKAINHNSSMILNVKHYRKNKYILARLEYESLFYLKVCRIKVI